MCPYDASKIFKYNRYSVNVVDMDPASNGNYATGAVTSKNNSMPGAPTSTTEALASCPHWNGYDEWVVGHDETK